MSFIAVIDYGMGNLRSVAKALQHVVHRRIPVLITNEPAKVRAAERVVFPGQGAARDCMRELARSGLDEAVREAARSKPFLGLCMGMQALMEFSEENGGTKCLGLLPGRVCNFDRALEKMHNQERLKVPHVGWNQVAQTQSHPLWKGISDQSRFYFVHSYYVLPENPELIPGTTKYGICFASAIGRDNVFAMQCHPEKSATAGLTLLANFIRWNGTV